MSDTRTGSLRLRAWCSCGGSIDASSTPPPAAEECVRIWRDEHDRLGHRPCDKETAAKARRVERRQMAARDD